MNLAQRVKNVTFTIFTMKRRAKEIDSTESTKEKAVKFFRVLAAGAPYSNVTWGKSEREIKDFYALAAIALEKELENGGTGNEA